MSGGISSQKELSGISQGAAGVPICGDVQGMTRHDIQCSGLVDKMVMGHRLGSKISEVFSNPNDSVVAASLW